MSDFFFAVFQEATAFNGDVSSWQTGKVTTMGGSKFFFVVRALFSMSDFFFASPFSSSSLAAFQNAAAFNADVSNWDVSKVTSMNRMFSSATSFAWPLCGVHWINSEASKDFMFDGSKGFIGDTLCAVCQSGQYSTISRDNCLLCPKGFYNDQVEQYACKVCDAAGGDEICAVLPGATSQAEQDMLPEDYSFMTNTSSSSIDAAIVIDLDNRESKVGKENEALDNKKYTMYLSFAIPAGTIVLLHRFLPSCFKNLDFFFAGSNYVDDTVSFFLLEVVPFSSALSPLVLWLILFLLLSSSSTSSSFSSSSSSSLPARSPHDGLTPWRSIQPCDAVHHCHACHLCPVRSQLI
jgi:surface protein